MSFRNPINIVEQQKQILSVLRKEKRAKNLQKKRSMLYGEELQGEHEYLYEKKREEKIDIQQVSY